MTVKRCPFVVLQDCFEDKCAVWRIGRDGVGYCGAGGPPERGPATRPASGVIDTTAISIDKQTTDGAPLGRQTRRQRS